jgi:hypothetical protein
MADEIDTVEANTLSIVVNQDIEKRVTQFRDLRDAIKLMEEKHKEELKPYQDSKDRVAGIIRVFMETNKLENLRTKSGTATLSTRYTATVADGGAFMDFVKAGNFDLIERRANSTAVKAYVEEHKHLPPGVNLGGVQVVGVTKPTGKAKFTLPSQ